MPETRAQFLKNLDRRLRAVVEKRLEEGYGLTPSFYNFTVMPDGGVHEDYGEEACTACLLGNVVLAAGRVSPFLTDPKTCAAEVLGISYDQATFVERGFMGWGRTGGKGIDWDLYDLGAAIRRDYYETTAPAGELPVMRRCA